MTGNVHPLPGRPPAAGRSAWDTEDGGYHPGRFYVKSTDGHGHREDIRVRVPPYIYGRMQAIIQSARIPAYKTFADIGRDALVHRLHWLANNMNDPVLQADLSAHLSLHLMDARVAASRAMLARVNSLKDEIGKLSAEAMKASDPSGLHEDLDFIEVQCDILREPFRGQVLRLIAECRKLAGPRLDDGGLQ